MKPSRYPLILLLTWTLFTAGPVSAGEIDHSAFDSLLQKAVGSEGGVDYELLLGKTNPFHLLAGLRKAS